MIWDQGRLAYALTDAGRETVARIEDHFHCERQREPLGKLRGKPTPEDDAEPGTSGDVTPHIVRLYFNLVADAKSLAQTLGEVKQSLEFGGVTLEENLGKLLYCSSLEAEIGRMHTWICDLYDPVLDASRNQQRLLLQSAMAENAAEFASIAAVASKLALDCPQGGNFAGKLIAILYAVHSRGGGPFLPADAQDDGCGFREVAMTYARHRARDLRESIERDPSVDKIAQSLYNERRALGFLFRSKLMARKGRSGPRSAARRPRTSAPGSTSPSWTPWPGRALLRSASQGHPSGVGRAVTGNSGCCCQDKRSGRGLGRSLRSRASPRGAAGRWRWKRRRWEGRSRRWRRPGRATGEGSCPS